MYRDIDSAKVGLIDNILKESGIPTMLRNWTGSGITEVPIPVMYPNVCVMNRSDIARAREIIDEYFNADYSDQPEWTCPKMRRNQRRLPDRVLGLPDVTPRLGRRRGKPRTRVERKIIRPCRHAASNGSVPNGAIGDAPASRVQGSALPHIPSRRGPNFLRRAYGRHPGRR